MLIFPAVHFGHPTDEQCEAFTRVLKGHVSYSLVLFFGSDFLSGQIAIDQIIFPMGTTGAQLDVLARQALWRDGLNYLVRCRLPRGDIPINADTSSMGLATALVAS